KQRAAGMPANRWLSGMEDASPGKLRLFCFPHAGAGALAYRAWIEKLRAAASVAAIRLPGRESRIAEAPFENMEDLVPALAASLAPALQPPFAFFGHSMGAGIAFELVRWLRRNGRPLPRSLHVSAARAPQERVSPP